MIPQSKRLIHVGGYRLTPSGIGIASGNFPTWCSEGSSSPDFIRGQKNRQSNQQATLTLVSAGNDLRVSTMRPDPKSAKLNSEGEIQGLSSVDFSDN